MMDIIRSGDDHFIRWALTAVLEWENSQVPQPFFHIHGSRDEVFPIGLTKHTHILPKAGHMFLIYRADAVNQLLSEILVPLALPGTLPTPTTTVIRP
jgi:pimeloyl-ACP methyl ester carboxylesterase